MRSIENPLMRILRTTATGEKGSVVNTLSPETEQRGTPALSRKDTFEAAGGTTEAREKRAQFNSNASEEFGAIKSLRRTFFPRFRESSGGHKRYSLSSWTMNRLRLESWLFRLGVIGAILTLGFVPTETLAAALPYGKALILGGIDLVGEGVTALGSTVNVAWEAMFGSKIALGSTLLGSLIGLGGTLLTIFGLNVRKELNGSGNGRKNHKVDDEEPNFTQFAN